MSRQPTQKYYALSRLDRLFVAELQAFETHFDVAPVPVEQDLRAGAIGWIATFAPESIGPEGRERLSRILAAVRGRDDYRTFGWYRIPYLYVAWASLSGDHSCLSDVTGNIDHHNSSLRSALYAPLGLIAPELSINDDALRSRMESSLKSGLMYNDSLMCVFLALNGNPQHKVKTAMEWRENIDLAPQDACKLDSIINDGRISNSLIANELSEVLRYVLCRLLDPDIRDTPPDGQFDLGPDRVDCSIWRRMADHPLLSSFVSLK